MPISKRVVLHGAAVLLLAAAAFAQAQPADNRIRPVNTPSAESRLR